MPRNGSKGGRGRKGERGPQQRLEEMESLRQERTGRARAAEEKALAPGPVRFSLGTLIISCVSVCRDPSWETGEST